MNIDNHEKNILIGAIIISTIPIITAFIYLILFSLNFPALDDWLVGIPLSIKFHSGHGDILSLFTPHSDIIPLIPNLIIIPTLLSTSFNISILHVFLLLIHILGYLTLSIIIWRKIEDPIAKSIALILTSFYFFNLYLVGYMLSWGVTGIYYPCFVFFLLLTFLCLDLSKGIDLFFVLSIISGIFCFFSHTPGLFIWCGVIVMLLFKNRNDLKRIIFWSVPFILVVLGRYYINLNLFISQAQRFSSYNGFISDAINYPIYKLISFICAIGSNVTHDFYCAFFLGILMIFIGLVFIYINQEKMFFQEIALWGGLITTIIITTLFLIMGRTGSDFSLFIPAGRHFTSTFLLLIAMFGLILQVTVKMKKNRDINMILLGITICLLLCGSMFHFIPGVAHGIEWFHYSNNTGDIYNTFDIPSEDYEDSLNYLKENNLSIFDPKQDRQFNGKLLDNIREAIDSIYKTPNPKGIISFHIYPI